MPKTTSALNVLEEFDTEFLETAPEIDIFSACRHLLEQVKAAERALKVGEMNGPEFRRRVKALLSEFCKAAQATERFDIVVPYTPEAAFSPFFWRWFNWWNDYRDRLTRDELKKIHRLQATRDRAALRYRPAGHWLKYRDEPQWHTE
jgi:hypothetical protein